MELDSSPLSLNSQTFRSWIFLPVSCLMTLEVAFTSASPFTKQGEYESATVQWSWKGTGQSRESDVSNGLGFSEFLWP